MKKNVTEGVTEESQNLLFDNSVQQASKDSGSGSEHKS